MALYGRTNTSSEQKAVAHILFFDQTLTWACCWKINEGKTEQCHVPNFHAYPVATELNLAKTARFMSTDCYLHPQRAAFHRALGAAVPMLSKQNCPWRRNGTAKGCFVFHCPKKNLALRVNMVLQKYSLHQSQPHKYY